MDSVVRLRIERLDMSHDSTLLKFTKPKGTSTEFMGVRVVKGSGGAVESSTGPRGELFTRLWLVDRYEIDLVQWAVPLMLYPAFVGWKAVRRRGWTFRKTHNLCVKCGYDLRGSVSGLCTECGTTIADDEEEREARRRHERIAADMHSWCVNCGFDLADSGAAVCPACDGGAAG